MIFRTVMKRSDACICMWNHPENMRLIQVAKVLQLVVRILKLGTTLKKT